MSQKNVKMFIWALVVALIIVGVFFLSKNFLVDENKGPQDLDHFVECLNKKEIFLYGSPNDNNVKAQLNLFENYSNQIKVVDCTMNSSVCEGIIIFPTWRVNGVLIHGSLSLNVLSKFSGC